MKRQRLTSLIGQSLRRNRRHFVLSAVGVVIGISTLFFFTSLGQGVRTTVLEEVFVIDQLEVVDPAASAGLRQDGIFGGGGLTDNTAESVRQIDGVDKVYPRMKLTFPSRASGGQALMGSNVGIEFIADGIPAEIAADDASDILEFRDYGEPISCDDDASCPQGHTCQDGTCTAQSCTSNDGEPCGEVGYCDTDANQCALPIPLVISPYLLEVYNGSLHTALSQSQGIGSNLPRLTEQMLVGFEFDITFGQSYMGHSDDADRVRKRARIVGFSDRAMQLGATMPIGYVQRYNAEFSGEDAAKYYHSLLVDTERNEDVAPVTQRIESDLGLELSDRHKQAQRAGLLILLITVLFNVIALIILAVSALNITHTFSMMVMKRRREIGLMRAVGATRRQIQLLVIGEATVVGLIAGTVGIAMGIATGLAVDAAFARFVGDFPFKPDSLFAWSPWMFALGLATAILFCLIGALMPAIRAGRLEPAQTLIGR